MVESGQNCMEGVALVMAHFMVYWPQDWVDELKKAGDKGPIKVVYGSIHSRMPTIASVKAGDVVFPVTLMKKKLYVMARLPVTHRERAFDYCMRELGCECGALIPEGIAVEWDGGFYAMSGGKSFRGIENAPEGVRIVGQKEKPHAKHQEPFNCCSQWAVWGEEGSVIEPRALPEDVISLLRFGYPKSKERALLVDKNGNVLVSSLTATRRMSEETAGVFEGLF